MLIVSCKNCSTRYRGRYCPHCGQKARTGRLNWTALWDNLAYSVTNVERGMFFTIKELFTRPGYMMRDYLAGKRINYFRPFSMMVILTTTYVFLSALVFPDYPELERMSRKPAPVPTEESVRRPGPAEGSLSGNSNESFNIRIFGENYTGDDLDNFKDDWENSSLREAAVRVLSNPVFWLFFILLFFAFAVRLVFRWNGAKRYHYVEHLFAGAYLICQFLIVMIALLPYRYFTQGRDPAIEHETLLALLFIALPAWDYRQLFKVRWVPVIFKTILLYVMTVLSAVLMAVIILGIIVALAFLLRE